MNPNYDYPPEVNTEIDKENKNEGLDILLNKIARFDTDGYSEYNIEGFKEKVLEKGIMPGQIIDQALNDVVISERDDFSIAEMRVYSAMRAWLHCDYENATQYIREQFNFECNEDNVSFLKKYVFLNFVAILISENRDVDEDTAARSPIVRNERSVFSELRKSVNKNQGSFLLNYFGQNFLDVIDNKRDSVQGDLLDYKPFEIAPDVFAFDRKSFFVMISKHSIERDGIFISQAKDSAHIKEILKNSPDNKIFTQEYFDSTVDKFEPLDNKYKLPEIDLEIYQKLNSPYHRKQILETTGIKVSDLEINEQVFFLNYLKFANQEKLKTIQDFHKNYGNQALRTFLSIGKGGIKMGDKIVNLGERLPHDQAQEIFKGYGDLIDSAQKLSGKISDEFDKNNVTSDESLKGLDIKKLPNELVDSLMLRAKDILIGAEKVLEGERLNTADVTDAVLGINTLVSILANINEAGSEYQYKKLESAGNKAGEYLNKYLVTDKNGFDYNLKVFVRPVAEEGAQARVNIELSFDTQKSNERLQKAFYNETVNYKESKKNTGSVLRIGIDRDDYNYEGAVSLDIGRSERETDKYARTGDVLGKLLSMTSGEGHHETTAFSKEFADPENFAKITTMLAKYFEQGPD